MNVKIINYIKKQKRVFFLFLFSFFILFAFIFQLFNIQVNKYHYYTKKLNAYMINEIVEENSRGNIYDRNGELLVGNEATTCFVYYYTKNYSEEDKKLTAKNMANSIDFSLPNLTYRDKKDCLLLWDKNYVLSFITKEDLMSIKDSENYDLDYYNLQLSVLTDDIIDTYFQEEQLLKEVYLFFLIQQTSSTSKKVIIQNLSIAQASYLSEKMDQFRGCFIETTYKRVYMKEGAEGILGSISTSVPAEKALYYSALDQQLNRTIGSSGLEEEYDEVLKGTDSRFIIEYDAFGNPTKKYTYIGKNGNDLYLTIDWNLQGYLSNRVEEELRKLILSRSNANAMYITLMDPNNGDIIAMVGKKYNTTTGEIYDYAEGNYLASQTFGSSIKAAVVYTGYLYDAIYQGETINDTRWYFKDGSYKGSYKDLGRVNDIDALAYSSNIYMYTIATRIANGYYSNSNFYLDTDVGFRLLRKSLGEFGLGVKTLIDIPNEETGYKGSADLHGFLLDEATGQYDTYTTIQMSQYASTIANKGKRLKPKLANYIKETNTDKIKYFETEILDDLSQNTIAFDRIHLGLRKVVTNGTATILNYSKYQIAAKTGTAETSSGANISLIAFAPYENPQISYTCSTVASGNSSACQTLAIEAIEIYLDNYGE